jgi:hypothetical protein
MNSIKDISRKGSIAVMQPYFFPYAGYFRLFAQCERVVLFDCVQYTRRTWISRNRFLRSQGDGLDWLNMPIKKTQRDVKINQIEFREESVFDLEKFKVSKELSRRHIQFLFDVEVKPVDLLARQINWVLKVLEIECEVIHSSSLQLNEEFRGQSRVIEIANRLGASTYVNLSGGLDLYDQESFRQKGLDLKILKPYSSSKLNILDRIVTETSESISNEIFGELEFFN